MAAKDRSRGRGSNRVDELTSTTQRQAGKKQERNPLPSELLMSGLLLKVLTAFRVDLPTSVHGVQRIPHRYAQRTVFKLISDPIQLTMRLYITEKEEEKGGGRGEGQPV